MPDTDLSPSHLSELSAVVADLRKHLAWVASEGGPTLLISHASAAALAKAGRPSEAKLGAPGARTGPVAPGAMRGRPTGSAPSPAPGATADGTRTAAGPSQAASTPAAGPARASKGQAGQGRRPARAEAGELPPGAGGARPAAARSLFDLPKVEPVPEDQRQTLDEVRRELGDCQRCKLAGGRRQIVFGVGNPRANLVFVGEGPGAEEDAQGVPFVGKAGQLLTKMIEAMGFGRDDVYICNVVKCRPPGNRNPEMDEIQACEPFLRAQLGALQPKIIVALGKFAAQVLLRDETPITRLRGSWREYAGVPLMPTFHPAYLLRNPAEKKAAWSDLQQVMKALGKAPRGGTEG